VRVVFDTNIFVSALVIPDSRAEEAVLRVVEGQDHLIISKAILHELLITLSGKFSRDQEELAHVAVFLTEMGELVYPKRKVNTLRDDPDNRILECALAGHADAVVTGDRAMLALGQYKGIKILTLKEYLKSS
jgi:putative PIN family toxin of toxin-antitoxin system